MSVTQNPATPRNARPSAWPATLVVASLLTACGAEPPALDREKVPASSPAPTVPLPNIGGEQPVEPTTPLPPTRELQVTVEGQVEWREASLFESPQGYAIYVLPQLIMTAEEPCCDIAWARVDDGFFMRIERIDPDQDLAVLQERMELALSAVGEAEALPDGQIGARHFHNAELSMVARGDGISNYMMLARVDGGRYRVTLHLPHREALEGIAPSMWAMLSSLRTTGPRPPV